MTNNHLAINLSRLATFAVPRSKSEYTVSVEKSLQTDNSHTLGTSAVTAPRRRPSRPPVSASTAASLATSPPSAPTLLLATPALLAVSLRPRSATTAVATTSLATAPRPSRSALFAWLETRPVAGLPGVPSATTAASPDTSLRSARALTRARCATSATSTDTSPPSALRWRLPTKDAHGSMRWPWGYMT